MLASWYLSGSIRNLLLGTIVHCEVYTHHAEKLIDTCMHVLWLHISEDSEPITSMGNYNDACLHVQDTKLM